jgi:hypothetical protein
MERAVRSDLSVLGRGRLVGFPFFSLSASRYFSDKETFCLYCPLGTLPPWDCRHCRSEGVRLLRWVLRSSGNVSRGGWERRPLGGVDAELRGFARRFKELIVVPY